jgi:hypothetical protein
MGLLSCGWLVLWLCWCCCVVGGDGVDAVCGNGVCGDCWWCCLLVVLVVVLVAGVAVDVMHRVVVLCGISTQTLTIHCRSLIDTYLAMAVPMPVHYTTTLMVSVPPYWHIGQVEVRMGDPTREQLVTEHHIMQLYGGDVEIAKLAIDKYTRDGKFHDDETTACNQTTQHRMLYTQPYQPPYIQSLLTTHTPHRTTSHKWLTTHT